MDARFKTTVQQFAISRGILRERPVNVAAIEPPADGPHSSRGRLFIVAEMLGNWPKQAELTDKLLEQIQDTYYQSSGSVTQGITDALAAATLMLFEENLNLPFEQRGAAGVACAVQRDGELFLGVIGPALAYLIQPDGMRRFPEESPWLQRAIPSDEDRAAWPAMGMRRTISPRLYHSTLDQGDVLVLASPVLARIAPAAMLAEAVGKGGRAGRERLRTLAGGRDMSALLVSWDREAEVTPAAMAPKNAAAPAAEEDEAFVDVDLGLSDEDYEEVDEEEEEGEEEPEVEEVRPLRIQRDGTAAVGSAWQSFTSAWRQLARNVANTLRDLLPERSPRTPVAGQRVAARAPRANRNLRIAAVLAILIPLVAFVLVTVSRYQYERSRKQQVATFLTQANASRQAAAGATAKDVVRTNLRKAIEYIDQALAIAPKDADALKLREQVVDQLDVAGSVQRLYTVWELVDLNAGGASPAAEAGRLVVHGDDLYILDRGADRAFHRHLNTAGDALDPVAPNSAMVSKGEQKGTITVGELQDMVWMPSGGERKTSNLLILERNGSLLDYDASRGITVLPIADSATWRKPVGAGAFAGNFYLLDAQQNRILKYVPASGGYTNVPSDYITQSGSDLSTAVDMGIDGRVYVLLADGRVLKFLSGKPQAFNVTDLDQPLSNPVAICVTGEDETKGSIYIADAGLARVVQLSKTGQFVRQYKVVEGQAQMASLRGLFVDEARQRLYFAAGTKVFMAPLAGTGPVMGPAPAPTATQAR